MDDELLQRLGAPMCRTCGAVISSSEALLQDNIAAFNATIPSSKEKVGVYVLTKVGGKGHTFRVCCEKYALKVNYISKV